MGCTSRARLRPPGHDQQRAPCRQRKTQSNQPSLQAHHPLEGRVYKRPMAVLGKRIEAITASPLAEARGRHERQEQSHERRQSRDLETCSLELCAQLRSGVAPPMTRKVVDVAPELRMLRNRQQD